MSTDGLPINPKIRRPWSARNKNEVKSLLDELARREVESLRLYRPLPFQEAYHSCKTKECLLMKANRAGGSLAGFVEDARAATGQDPHDKYPKENGVIVCLGYGESHIGRVIHRYLFRPGAFDIIQDEKTGEWRVFRPWGRDDEIAEKTGEPGDRGREKLSLPSPPLIPKRYIKGKPAWVKRAHYVFYRYDLTTGWTIYAANSKGDPNHVAGFDVNLCHIDEDLATSGWYEEMTPRTTKPNGFMRWTALPLSKNDDMLTLMERFEQDHGNPNKTTTLLQASIFENPYLPKEAVEHNIKIWSSQGADVLARRAYGQMSNNEIKVYPTFNERTLDYRTQFTPEAKLLQERNGDVPEDWCRYVSVDPGHTTLAIGYFAVPPSGKHIYFYAEDYILGGDANKFGEAMSRRSSSVSFQAFIIDSHGGNLRELGSGYTPREQYSRQLQNRNVRSVETLFDFINGSDDVKGRETIMRECLRVQEDGSTRLIINQDGCPNFIREMKRFKKKTVERGSMRLISDDSDRRFNTHAIETVEYALAHGLPYVPPKKQVSNKTYAERMIEQDRARADRYRAINGHVASNTITLGPIGVS